MQALFFTGNGHVNLRQVDKPEPSGDTVIVKVRASAICGTDRENYIGDGQERIPGHEIAGIVESVDAAERVRPGDRVALNVHIRCGNCRYCVQGKPYLCSSVQRIGADYNGGFAEYIAVPESCCMPLHDDISFEAGCLMVDQLGTAYSAVDKLGPLYGKKILLTGAGPIGLGVLTLAVQQGAEVMVADTSDYRLRFARDFGARRVIDPKTEDIRDAVFRWTDGKGPAAVTECSGNSDALRNAVDLVCSEGTVMIVGLSDSLILQPWEDVISREVTIRGSVSFRDSLFKEMEELILSGLQVEKVITHRFALADAAEAFRVFAEGNCLKIVFTN